MATSNPASISRFAEIGRQEIIAEARREQLALEAVRGRVQATALDEPHALDVPVSGEPRPANRAARPVLARVRAVVSGAVWAAVAVVGSSVGERLG